MSTTTTIALVGHCTPDAFALTSAVRSMIDQCDVVRVNDTESLNGIIDNADLLLVNRVLDGAFGTESGIELISELASDAPNAMLISNYQESIDESVRAGAKPGFGKTDMRSDRAHDAIKAALNTEEH